MTTTIISLDVVGSFRNPVVFWAVMAWTAVLMLSSGMAARAWLRSRSSQHAAGRGRGVAVIAALVTLYIATPVVEDLVAQAWYMHMRTRPDHVYLSSVGFFGGPFMIVEWILTPWLAGLVVWSIVARRMRRTKIA